MNASSPHDPLKIIIYGYQNAQLESIADIKVQEVNGASEPRWTFFSRNLNSWILFLDKDCTITLEIASQLKSEIRYLDKRNVYSGQYLTSSIASAHETAYNWLCNNWRNLGEKQNDPRVLGGCFLIYCSENFLTKEFQNLLTTIPKWGAEDFHFSRILKKQGVRILPLASLSVLHQPNFTVFKFFRRAFLHGFNRPADLNLNSRRSIFEWLLSLKGLRLLSQLFILLHLLTVGIGVFVSKFHSLLLLAFQKNKFLKLKY